MGAVWEELASKGYSYQSCTSARCTQGLTEALQKPFAHSHHIYIVPTPRNTADLITKSLSALTETTEGQESHHPGTQDKHSELKGNLTGQKWLQSQRTREKSLTSPSFSEAFRGNKASDLWLNHATLTRGGGLWAQELNKKLFISRSWVHTLFKFFFLSQLKQETWSALKNPLLRAQPDTASSNTQIKKITAPLLLPAHATAEHSNFGNASCAKWTQLTFVPRVEKQKQALQMSGQSCHHQPLQQDKHIHFQSIMNGADPVPASEPSPERFLPAPVPFLWEDGCSATDCCPDSHSSYPSWCSEAKPHHKVMARRNRRLDMRFCFSHPEQTAVAELKALLPGSPATLDWTSLSPQPGSAISQPFPLAHKEHTHLHGHSEPDEKGEDPLIPSYCRYSPIKAKTWQKQRLGKQKERRHLPL